MDERDRPAIRCTDVLYAYFDAGATSLALRGVDLVLEHGRVAALAGPSGSGKSTLLRVLAGVDSPTAGDVVIAGHNLVRLQGRERARFMRRQIAYVFQHPADNVVESLTVDGNLVMAAYLRDVEHFEPAVLRQQMPLLADTGRARVGDLSDGQQQCLAFLMATVGQPALIIADEPTAELDETEARLVLDTLRAAAERGVTSLFATHDPLILAEVDDVIRIRHGRVVSSARHGATLAPIDAGGWIPLPPDADDHLPNRAASVRWHDDHYEIWPR